MPANRETMWVSFSTMWKRYCVMLRTSTHRSRRLQKATGPEFGAELGYAIERGWLWKHESGTYLRLMKTEAAS
ncbi:hypothetical protein AC630_39345 [Bradyrhizobium sp. AS23.2]|nr:hypothetical protein AC630_39345 [Bradyrhizobium sp. AS23.2]